MEPCAHHRMLTNHISDSDSTARSVMSAASARRRAASASGTPIHHSVSRPVRATPAQVFAGLRDFLVNPTKYLNTASDAVTLDAGAHPAVRRVHSGLRQSRSHTVTS